MGTKSGIVFDWDTIQTRLNNDLLTNQAWSYYITGVGWNSAAAHGVLGLAVNRNVDLANAKTKFLAVYNNSKNAGYIATASYIRNLPTQQPYYDAVLLLGGYPADTVDLWYLTFAKKVLGLDLPDFPTALECYNGYPIEYPNYFASGYHGHYGRVTAAGTGLGGYWATHQDLAFMHNLLWVAVLNGETGFFDKAKGFLDAWLAKYPTFTDESNDPKAEPQLVYKFWRTWNLINLIADLHTVGLISDTALTNTYLPKIENRIQAIEGIDISGVPLASEVLSTLLNSEILYHNMKAETSIPDNYTGKTLAQVIDGINNYMHYGLDLDYVWRTYGLWGVLVKYTIPVAIGSVITIKSQSFQGTLNLSSDGLTLNETNKTLSPAQAWSVIVNAVTKNQWNIRLYT